jgi:hypothetical protein
MYKFTDNRRVPSVPFDFFVTPRDPKVKKKVLAGFATKKSVAFYV